MGNEFNIGDDDWEIIMSSRSDGRKVSHTASESAATLKAEETRDVLEASLGDVKEIILETHSSGKYLVKSIFLRRYSSLRARFK